MTESMTPQNPLNAQASSIKPITIPFSLFCSLLFNKRDSFLEDHDMFMRERMPVSKSMGELLMIWDKEGVHCKVLPPRSEFNDTEHYVAYTAEAWKSSSIYFNKLKDDQQYTQSQIILREEKIKELSAALQRDAGFDAEASNQFAKLKVMMRDVTWCMMMFKVDISMLSEDITKKTKIL